MGRRQARSLGLALALGALTFGACTCGQDDARVELARARALLESMRTARAGEASAAKLHDVEARRLTDATRAMWGPLAEVTDADGVREALERLLPGTRVRVMPAGRDYDVTITGTTIGELPPHRSAAQTLDRLRGAVQLDVMRVFAVERGAWSIHLLVPELDPAQRPRPLPAQPFRAPRPELDPAAQAALADELKAITALEADLRRIDLEIASGASAQAQAKALAEQIGRATELRREAVPTELVRALLGGPRPPLVELKASRADGRTVVEGRLAPGADADALNGALRGFDAVELSLAGDRVTGSLGEPRPLPIGGRNVGIPARGLRPGGRPLH